MSAIDDFLAMLASERGAAANTIAAYRRDLNQAQEWLGPLESAAATDLAKLEHRWASLASSSAARKASALRQFFGFLVDEHGRPDDPSHALPRPAIGRSLPKILDHEEIAQLFACAEQEAVSDDSIPLRTLTLIELLYGSGLRASELVALPLAAIPRDAPLMTITGKGGVQRLVPVSTRADQALRRWLTVRPPDGGYLFPSGGSHLTRVRLYQLVKGLAGRAGIDPQKVSPHVMRHAFATHLLEGGADLRVLQTLLGHADISTTQIYTHVDASRLVKLVNERHPLARTHPSD
ncbi:tyrosine recombinase [Qipengyuania sp.]|uniref:tyrosine recombinase n=1 Tax=Qipengyuania sp. TaxID=2004515 RepID=UPI0035C80AA1